MKPAMCFDRDQLICIVDTILRGALECISNLPHNVSWEERQHICHDVHPCILTWFENGAIESSGNALGILVGDLCGDGLSAYDALEMADGFNRRLENLVRQSWEDRGEAIHNEMKRRGDSGYPFTAVYDEVYPGLYPDTRKHAEVFVDGNFREYLGLGRLRGETTVLLHHVLYYLELGDVTLNSAEEDSVRESVEELAKEMILHGVSEGDLIQSFDGATLKGRWQIFRR